jgi:hypothetical protein
MLRKGDFDKLEELALLITRQSSDISVLNLARGCIWWIGSGGGVSLQM